MASRDTAYHPGDVMSDAETDAIVFTGGVDENTGEIRERICAGLGVLDVVRPDGTTPPHGDAVISAPTADVAILVVHAREDLEISREVRELIDRKHPRLNAP